ncbi:MAG: 1-deoxy-D-xylulose-5-phosphate reductoisomerase [Johnsonella sp.]|nr:1-deoxy-D-xylulose-5-phosphate reductoisomerase [Johnsonella sp.]
MKKISILGSTGSIGTQTLDIVRSNRDIKVLGLAAGANIGLLEKQIREFEVEFAAVWQEEDAKLLREKTADTSCKILSGMEGLKEIAALEEIDTVLSAIVGMIGIEPNLAAIRAGKDLALANKESLVCAGHIIMPLAKEKGVRILPVDSEHSAVFQCIQGNEHNPIERLILTASGGPFRGYEKKRLEEVSLEAALRHPNWSMGKKISIDSSTMVNKGLELIEACRLFDLHPDQVEILIQPSSVIHSMVEFADKAVMAQLGTPDMKLPIQYALYYPKRVFLAAERLDFAKLGGIEMEKPDFEVFTALPLAYAAAKEGQSMPTVYNAANEYAVARFLERKIRYLEITAMIEEAMAVHRLRPASNIEEIFEIQRETEEFLIRRFGVR